MEEVTRTGPNYQSLIIPEVLPISGEGHVAQPEMFTSRNELLNLWNNQNEMADDRIIYAYLRYLATVFNDRRIAVVAPFYTDPNLHFGPGAMNLNLDDYCYNHSAEYDVLLIPVIFPGHFTLLIFDRTNRQQQKCLFIDSLPPMFNVTADFRDRLHDSHFPGYDQNRIILLTQTICQLTPGLNQNDFEIHVMPPTDYTRQTDAINCGFFTILYAESYLMNNGCLILQNLDINSERKRIISQIAHLLMSDAVPYLPRQEQRQQNPEQTSTSFHCTPLSAANRQTNSSRRIVISRESSVHSNASSRRSERIASRNASRESSIDPQQNASVDSNPLTKRCHLRHRDYPCADVRSLHTPVYYDSGILGDKKCDFCSALLFNSEASTKKSKTSSWYCCKFGKVSLPEITEPPAELLELATDITPEAKEYRQHQNTYNSLLAFASVSVGHQENTTGGSVCFMLNGVFVRRISSLFSGNSTPSFAQLFILDPEAALEQRMQNTRYGGDRVNQVTLKKLDLLLRQYHPLAKQLLNFHEQYNKTLQERGPDAVQNFRLTLLEARITPNEVRDSTLHSRQTNLPTEGTMFSVWTESERAPVQHGIWITTAEGELRKIQPYHPQTDTLCYPLIIPCGDDGYHKNLTVKATKQSRRQALTDEVDSDDNEDGFSDVESQMDISECETMSNNDSNQSNISLDEPYDYDDAENKPMTLRDYVRYRTAIRRQNYHHIWSAAGGLSQKLILDYAARIDADVANYLRRPELNLRGTLPEHLLRWFARNAGLTSPEEIGSVVLYRKFHPGTRAYFQEMYYNATNIMARVRTPRNACFMFTWTCNPRWPEIKNQFMQRGQKIADRFDLLCRIYEDKLRQIHYLMDKKNIFGKQTGFAESREFQKRAGGPHLHRIFQSDIPAISEAVDNLIWAFIPAEPNECDQSGWANFIRKIRELLPKYQLHDC
ncbi:hypothetical protein niasHS_008522 [Heterodera schachtii]|uniref:Helitron helicase-like domain-containing protein n=1 Tax=Heterodera schachtii TaxID=97005 RepID=A0ABD2J3B3_HETSC